MPTDPLHLTIQTWDPGTHSDSPEDYEDRVATLIETHWNNGADLVLLPEFTWLGIEPLLRETPNSKAPDELNTETTPLHLVARHFEQNLLPRLKTRLTCTDKAAVLGTVPSQTPSGQIVNRAHILSEGHWHTQDKLHLTPWESVFIPGKQLHLWKFGSWTCAVIICLDIEVPELSAHLRNQGVDLILCPSATENLLGAERVNRCASARSVELGCYVAVAHLTGRASSDLIDENIGKAALYRPSQAAFADLPREESTPLHDHANHALHLTLSHRQLQLMRRMHHETNPSALQHIFQA